MCLDYRQRKLYRVEGGGIKLRTYFLSDTIHRTVSLYPCTGIFLFKEYVMIDIVTSFGSYLEIINPIFGLAMKMFLLLSRKLVHDLVTF